MKKLLLMFFTAALLTAQGQVYTYVYGGYKTGFPALSNINREVYLYNYTRQWLTQEMEYFNRLEGFEFGYGWQFNQLGCYANFYAQWNMNEAYGIEPNTPHTGYRKITPVNYGTELAVQWYPLSGRYMELALGGSLNLAALPIFLNYRNSSTQGAETAMGSTGIMFGNSLMAQINIYPLNRIGIMIKPYYAFYYYGSDVSPLFKELQGASFPYPLYEFPNHFGLVVSLMIADKDR